MRRCLARPQGALAVAWTAGIVARPRASRGDASYPAGMQVPGFIARQFYVRGSLRNTPEGFQLEAHNPLGDGTLTGVGMIAVDGASVPVAAISALRAGDAAPITATDLGPGSPIHVRKGDRVTLRVRGPQLSGGEHRLEVELHERDLGALRFSLTDRLSG